MKTAEEWANEAIYCAKIHITDGQKMQSISGLIGKIQIDALREAAEISLEWHLRGKDRTAKSLYDAMLSRIKELEDS